MKYKLHILLLILLLIVSGCAQEKPLSLLEKFNNADTGDFIIDQPGVYGDDNVTKEFKGDLYVKADGVKLQNINITGNLFLSEEIGEGDVELLNLNISDTVYIYGGGENSVRFRRTKSKHTLVYKPRKPVRIVVDKESKIDKITVQSSAILEGDTINEVSIEPKDSNIIVDLKGTFKEVNVKQTSKIVTYENTHIETIVVVKNAENTEIIGQGKIENIEVNAEKVNINVQVNNTYTNNNIKTVVVNNKQIDLIIDTEEIYHTADTWEVGMPWEPSWGPEPEGAWQPDSGVTWDPSWGPEPDDIYLPQEEPTEPDDIVLPQNGDGDQEEPVDSKEIYNTADTWEIGMPWDMEWGEEPEGAWQPDSGVPWDPSWGPEPDDIEVPIEPVEIEFEFITCTFKAISNPASIEITVSLTKPGTVYYVFEDISSENGINYLPSIEQIIAGNNALGNPNPKPAPDMGDQEFEFFTEAFVSGQINVLESGEEYKISIFGPTFSEVVGESFMGTPSGFNGSFVAVDEEGNKIIIQ